jgi:hypothetical protein
MGWQSLTMHWDGIQWSIIPSPNRSRYQFQDYLTGVTAISANDVWAVGYYYNQSVFRYNTLTLHWNGVAWSAISSPNNDPRQENRLTGVTALAANDVWAVGHHRVGSQFEIMSLHWTGTAWSLISMDSPVGYNNYLTAVTADNTGVVWTVGYRSMDSADNDTRPIALRWNGTAWQSSNPPYIASSTVNNPTGIAVVSDNDIWVVGYYGAARRTMILHRDGTAWTIFPGPNGSGSGNYLNGVAAGEAGNLWAVGNFAANSVTNSFTVRYPGEECAFPTVTPLTDTSTPTATLSATPRPSSTPTPYIAPTCGLGWHTVSSPNASSQANSLGSLAVVNRDDIWAGGTQKQHWDGRSWTLVPGFGANGMSGTATNDVWAVDTSAGGAYQTRIEHWDGNIWEIVPSPNPHYFYNFLSDVVALSPDNVWAVGYYDSTAKTLVLHWDGQSWTQIASPNQGTDHSYLTSIVALSANDIWAAGYYESQAGNQSLVLHWDGTQWSVSLAPPPVGGDRRLYDIAASGPNDVWAVGALIMHWNGASWTEVPNPVGGTLYGVAALDPNNAWAAGTLNTGTFSNETLLMYWDGSTWQRASTPNPDPYSSALSSLAVISPDNVWVVGYTGLQYNGSFSRTLTEHYFDPCVIPTPEPTSTSTPEPTATPVPPRCPGEQFTDVCPDDYFYVPTLSLANRGIVSGYNTAPPCDGPDHIPCFKPYSNVTRSQISKIVSNAANLSEDPGPQIYEDVPPSYPFYAWINRLSNRGYMGGYPCGTVPEEPCVQPDNRPYFRGANNMTRSQLTKIASNAAGLGGTPTGTFYGDVPLDHPFYTWIMRLTGLGVISGYPCGGEGEPCDGQERPYFRPYNNVIRGQASKIVYNVWPDPPTPTPTPTAAATSTRTATPASTSTSTVSP